VEYPELLHLNPYSKDGAQDLWQYRLIATVNHTGGEVFSGHYSLSLTDVVFQQTIFLKSLGAHNASKASFRVVPLLEMCVPPHKPLAAPVTFEFVGQVFPKPTSVGFPTITRDNRWPVTVSEKSLVEFQRLLPKPSEPHPHANSGRGCPSRHPHVKDPARSKRHPSRVPIELGGVRSVKQDVCRGILQDCIIPDCRPIIKSASSGCVLGCR
jgi:hypothetical protein